MDIHEKINLRGEGKIILGNIKKPENKVELKLFFKGLNWAKGDLIGETLYIQSKSISQSKLRDAGFFITRDKTEGLIVINNCEERYGIDTPSINEIYNDLNKKYTYVLDSDLYKYLYKYKGDLVLYNTLKDLINTDNKDNIKLAMEMMANADWSGNEIYLKELFANYYKDYLRGNSYKNSISFQGFLSSLDFRYDSIYFYDASSYKDICLTDEHHQFIFDKYKHNFDDRFESLMSNYKLKVLEFKYEIDKTKNENK